MEFVTLNRRLILVSPAVSGLRRPKWSVIRCLTPW